MSRNNITTLITANQMLYNAIDIIETIKTTPETAKPLGAVLALLDEINEMLVKITDGGGE